MIEGETRSSLDNNGCESVFSGEKEISAHFFYGDGCPHCDRVKPFIAQMEHEHSLTIYKYEIYHHRDNVVLLNQYFDTHVVPTERRGIPALFVSDSYLVGDGPILSGFEEVISEMVKEDSSVDHTSDIGVKTPEDLVQESACGESAGKSECLSIVTVTIAALIDSVSPCSLAVLLFLVGVRPLVTNRRKRALKVGLAFSFSVFLTYTLFGLGLLSVIGITGLSSAFGVVAGLVAIFAGIFYVKDYFWHGGGGFVMEVPRSLRPLVNRMIKSVASPLGAFFMGFAICCFELPCTGGPYLFILGQLANTATRLQTIPTLLYYNFLFIMPLLLISLLLYFGFFSLSRVREWNDSNKGLLRLVSGLIIIALGILVIPGSELIWLIRTFLGCCRVVLPPVLFTLSFYLVFSFLRVRQTEAKRFAKTILLVTLPVLSIFAYLRLFENVEVNVAANVGDADVEFAVSEFPSTLAGVTQSRNPYSETFRGSGDVVYERLDDFAGTRRGSMFEQEKATELTAEALAEIEERAKLYDEDISEVEKEYVYEPYLPVSNDLLKKYEPDYEKFEGIQIGEKIVYYQRRMLGEAIVEKDFVIYHFEKNTEELLDKKISWRDDLPEKLPEIKISREQAESMVEGEVRFSTLFFISPESDVFPIEPTPKNPCWVVRSENNDSPCTSRRVTVIDAITGEEPGYGIPPPYTGFSLTGPQDSNPCSGAWDDWATSARNWFLVMGYPTERVTWPTEAEVISHIESYETAMFYELAHGGSTSFKSGCVGGTSYEYTHSAEIEAWIADYNKMPFAFIGSCGGMCSTGDGTFAYEFRKGSNERATVVGYCNMDWSDCEDNCWPDSIDWQNRLFEYMYNGDTVKQAFDKANADYPACVGYSWGDCMRFAGDTNFAVKPVVKREPSCGDTIYGDEVLLSRDLYCSGNGLKIGNGGLILDCQGHYIWGSDTGIGIENTYNNVIIKNCIIRDFDYGIYMHDIADYNTLLNNGVRSNDYHGIYLNDAWNNDLIDNVVESNLNNGLYLWESKYNDIVTSTFRYNIWHGIHLSSATGNWLEDIRSELNDGNGIYLYNSNYTTIKDSVIDWNTKTNGLYLYLSNHNTIQTNDLYRNNDTIKLYYSHDNILYDNYVRLSEDDGLYMYSSNGNTISFNDITENGDKGIYMYLSHNNDILNNFFDDNGGYGVSMLSSDDNGLRNNIVNHPNALGVYSSTCYNTMFENNTVCGYSWDFYTPSSTYTADENTCDSAYQFVDSGQPNACDFKCSGCRRPEDDLYADRDLTFCPGTYNIQDAGSYGVIIAANDGITLTCDGTVLNGTDTGYGIVVAYGYEYVTVQNCELQNYLHGIVVDFDADHNNFINNKITSMASVGMYILRSEYNVVSGNNLTSNGFGVYLYKANYTDIGYNIIELNSYGVYISSSLSYYNYLGNNRVCSNPTRDIYNLGTDTSGDLNLCDVVHNYADSGQTYGCDFECSGCRRPEADTFIYTDTTLCPGTYNIPDTGSFGVLIVGEDSLTLDCNGAVLIGVDSRYGIYVNGRHNIRVEGCTVKNYSYGLRMLSSFGSEILNNEFTNNSVVGIYLNNSNSSLIDSNLVYSNLYGIYLYYTSKENIVQYNDIIGNGYGIVIYSANKNYVHGNIVEDSTSTGVYFSSNANDNILDHNRVCANPLDINDLNANSGDNNFCDTTNNWNDDGTTGCTCSCFLGDIDNDGDVDASDLFYLSKAYESKPADPNWHPMCDFDCDDYVDPSHLFDLNRNYGKTKPPAEGEPTNAPAAGEPVNAYHTWAFIFALSAAAMIVPKFRKSKKRSQSRHPYQQNARAWKNHFS